MSERHVFIPRGDGVSTCKACHGNDRDPVHASPALLKAERDISDLQEQHQSLQLQIEALQRQVEDMLGNEVAAVELQQQVTRLTAALAELWIVAREMPYSLSVKTVNLAEEARRAALSSPVTKAETEKI